MPKEIHVDDKYVMKIRINYSKNTVSLYMIKKYSSKQRSRKLELSSSYEELDS